ncbi:MAG: 4Fe-4S ferredoxin, partial [Phycisphaerae bacterium]|nr:4Fe-4S ferredoxin [Phycisphaerae bacterium]
GRCVECGACEAACPAGIPLMLLNVYLADEAAREFGYEAGLDPTAEPLIGSFRTDDKEEFIR